MTIFVGVVAVLMLSLSLSLIMDGIFGTSFRSGALVIGLVDLPLALFFVAGALRPVVLCTDDTGLRLQKAFGTRHLPWDAIQSFRVEPGARGPSLQATLRTGEVIWLPTPTRSVATARRIAGELTAALHDHV
jgi:hypothetical protein